MTLGIWIIVGLLVGFLVSKLLIRSGDGLLRDLALGVAGAVAAGTLFGVPDAVEAAAFSVFGLVVTFAGASAMLVVYHTLLPHVRR
jgi:uncharacterized membrane protein YeaQ/YmgE (transglycosylase-associated protein family)